MDNSCKHCDKADERADILICSKPCNRAKQWLNCETALIDILSGKTQNLKPKGE